MTTEKPADVIEQAAKVLARRSKHSWLRDLRQAQDLHDADLLADPADRDELVDTRAAFTKMHELEQRAVAAGKKAVARAERAEAEIAELRATVERVATLRDRWARMAGEAIHADARMWLDAASKSLRAALAGPSDAPDQVGGGSDE